MRGCGRPEVESADVSWEVHALTFDDFTTCSDFNRKVLKVMISSAHFIICVNQLAKKVVVLCYELSMKLTAAKYGKIQT